MPRFRLYLGLASTISLILVFYLLPGPIDSLPSSKLGYSGGSIPSSPVLFKDVSLEWNVLVAHEQSSKHLTALTETLGSGICVFDFDQDGWMDIFFVGGSGHSRHYGRKVWWNKASGNRLLLNKHGQYFEDVTESAGLEKRIWGMSCAVADFNNDGLSDLLITGVNDSALYKNSGDGKFVDVTAQSGIDRSHWSTSSSLVDFNQDGLLDIYISNYIRFQKGARTFERTSGFKTTGQVAFDPTLYDPEPNQLYLNKGDFQFEDIATNAGASNSLGRSLGARWFDLNQDRWPDLIVINDHNSPNQVFINEQGKNFKRGQDDYAAFEVAGAHDLAFGDFDRNGEIDFFMSRGMSHPPVLLTRPAEGGGYQDSAWDSRLARERQLPYTGWGSVSGDFNNDGLLDLYIANGMMLPDVDSYFVPQAQENSLYLNEGGQIFNLVEPARVASGNLQQLALSSRSVVSADLDNDGKLELIVSNNNNPVQILGNQLDNNQSWLGLDLLTENIGSEVYGAVLEIETDAFVLKQIFDTKQNFLGQSDPRLHVGLGDSEQVNKLALNWPDGTVSQFENLRANQYFVVGKNSNTITPVEIDRVDEPGHRLATQLSETELTAYTKLLLKATPESVQDELFQVWQVGAYSVQALLLKGIQKNWHSHYLLLVREALASANLELRLRAIDILQQAELEHSVAWLLPLLGDKSVEVQCAVARAFGAFFEEEEAVTHRKFLSVSPLIKLLETAVDDVRICVAHALGAAESKRAILPLLALLQDNRSIAAQAAAIRALGLIRDTRAKRNLISVVGNREASAQVVASALIALKRLNEPDLPALFNAVLLPNPGISCCDFFVRRYDILAYLFRHPDAIVFSREALQGRLAEMLAGNAYRPGTTAGEQKSKAMAILEAIAAGRAAKQIDWVADYLNQADMEVRLSALKALAAFNTPRSNRLLEQSLTNRPAGFLIRFLSERHNSPIPFSDDLIGHWADRFSGDLASLDALKQLMHELPFSSANRLFNRVLEKKLQDSEYLELFEFCGSDQSQLFVSNAYSLEKIRSQYTNSDLLVAFGKCYFGRHSPVANNASQIEKRLLLNRVISANSTGLSFGEKTTLLLTAASADVVVAKTMLAKNIAGKFGKFSALDK
ncbi:MAG: hypothetical protein GY814_11440, partial [Gammaproteobacteria bacterium]|nr:hypothetical protein [Gammaproteobacteria bacterium]